MKIVELAPLVHAAQRFAASTETRDIYLAISEWAEQAGSPSMAQSVCARVIDMCNPKAWGDRAVDDLDGNEWCSQLAVLAAVADDCGQAIYEASRASGGA